MQNTNSYYELFKDDIEKKWQAIVESAHEDQLASLQKVKEQHAAIIDKTLAISDFVAECWRKVPQTLYDLFLSGDFQKDFSQADVQSLFSHEIQSEIELDTFVRKQRDAFMCRLILRDVNDLAKTLTLTSEISWFADAVVQFVTDWHYQDLCKKFGTPIGRDSGQQQKMVILGMGKLGAYELNLSSDIDLIFTYPEAGETDGKRAMDNHQFFLKLGQKIIKSLDKKTHDGFVFRVDMRLRPYGSSGALALNFDAMELYYEDQGREWERYAMIKARAMAGNEKDVVDLMMRLRPFVYRKYTDFSAIQALRDMKALINREVKRLGKQEDVKLGAGGIREIEFIAQAYQLIFGGRDEALQERSVIKILELLEERQVLPASSFEELSAAYFFLRDAEHAIQCLNDEQTQRLPQDELKQARIAWATGYDNWDLFYQAYDSHRKVVRGYFETVVEDKSQEEKENNEECLDYWYQDEASLKQFLEEKGFTESEVNSFCALKRDSKVTKLEGISLQRFETFLPLFINALAEQEGRDKAVDSLIDLVIAVLRRTTYLVLLYENPHALKRLVLIASASPWIMKQLSQHPVLLDEVITASGLGTVPEPDELRELLRQQSLRIPVDDLEEQMGMLRYFRLAHHLHIVAAEASGTLPLMKVSDYLSFLAEAILEYVLYLSWEQMVLKYGYPVKDGEACEQPDFSIIGYGKLGGLELSHSSDLDLVFLYDADSQGATTGEKSVDNQVFFTRMGQRIIHLLTTRTILGQLYEVDMRLRPSGGKGLLVSTVDSFRKYQQEQAWTWEHQALVRARPIAGSPGLSEKFQQIRHEILSRQRNIDELRQEVVEMRTKMHDHLAPAYTKQENSELFHLKHSRGGIVDIEFMVQFCVLARACEFPEIDKYSDNIRILESLAQVDILTDEEVEALIKAYQSYRSKVHMLGLHQQKSEVLRQNVKDKIDLVTKLWQKLLG